jgi:hypothetical protein
MTFVWRARDDRDRTLLHRSEVGADLRVGLKPFLQAA